VVAEDVALVFPGILEFACTGTITGEIVQTTADLTVTIMTMRVVIITEATVTAVEMIIITADPEVDTTEVVVEEVEEEEVCTRTCPNMAGDEGVTTHATSSNHQIWGELAANSLPTKEI